MPRRSPILSPAATAAAAAVVAGVLAVTLVWSVVRSEDDGGSSSGTASRTTSASASASATTRAAQPGDRRAYRLTSPTEPVPGTRGKAVSRTTIALPATWAPVKGITEVLAFHEGRPGCTYRVTIVSRVRTGPEPTAAAHAAATVPGTGRYLLDEGRRRQVAWRVVRRRAGRQVVKVSAIRVAPLGFVSKQLGAKAWLETLATATSHPGDECHSGTYRDTLAGGLGDALATATVSAYIPA
jgi:hypothetical protein